MATSENAGNRGSPAVTERQSTPLHRACDACRSVKVKCLAGLANPLGPCQRCERTGRICVFAPVGKRKPRRKADDRIADLERQVRAMRLMLRTQKDETSAVPETETPVTPTPAMHTSLARAGSADDRGECHSSSQSPQASPDESDDRRPRSHATTHDLLESDTDIIDRGIITEAQAEFLFSAYLEHLNGGYPGALVPQDASCSHMRQAEPILWLAVVQAGSHGSMPHMADALYKQLIRRLADVIFLRAEKSLELIRALQLTIVYCYPLSDHSMYMSSQLSHIATGMIIDLGIWCKPGLVSGSGQLPPSSSSKLDQSSVIQGCRCLLSSYIFNSRFVYVFILPCLNRGSQLSTSKGRMSALRCWGRCRRLTRHVTCSSLSIRLRRPTTLPWSKWMAKCVTFLEQSRDVRDLHLVEWTRLNHIGEETAACLGLDDASMWIDATAGLAPIMRTFESRMEAWRQQVKPGVMSSKSGLIAENRG